MLLLSALLDFKYSFFHGIVSYAEYCCTELFPNMVKIVILITYPQDAEAATHYFDAIAFNFERFAAAGLNF